MDSLYDLLRFFHVMSFVFMSIPLFNLIVVNEGAALGTSFDYSADRYMENLRPLRAAAEDRIDPVHSSLIPP